MHNVEAIRTRPGMFIGDTRDGSGLMHMIWEVVSNSLDEHLAGRCFSITVEIAPDDSVTVEDDGSGLPLHIVGGIPFAQLALTSFHDAPTLDGHAPHEHIGKWGVGLFPVCALSSWLRLEVHRDGRFFSQRFERGLAVSELEDNGPTASRGTSITFAPDPSIFQTTRLDARRVASRLRELSYLLPKLSLKFREQDESLFHEPHGLAAFLDAKAPQHRLDLPVFVTSRLSGQIAVEAAARWDLTGDPSVDSFANVERTVDGGAHVRGLLQGFLAGLKLGAPRLCAPYALRELNRALSRGLTAVVCVRLRDPTYDRPTKSRLVTPEARLAVRSCIAEAFREFVENEPEIRRHLETLLRTAG
jgi:DNA gyrase subunit B